jgi:hypothetical protein
MQSQGQPEMLVACRLPIILDMLMPHTSFYGGCRLECALQKDEKKFLEGVDNVGAP